MWFSKPFVARLPDPSPIHTFMSELAEQCTLSVDLSRFTASALAIQGSHWSPQTRTEQNVKLDTSACLECLTWIDASELVCQLWPKTCHNSNKKHHSSNKRSHKMKTTSTSQPFFSPSKNWLLPPHVWHSRSQEQNLHSVQHPCKLYLKWSHWSS